MLNLPKGVWRECVLIANRYGWGAPLSGMLIPTDEYMPTAHGSAYPSLATRYVDELAGVSHGFSISGSRHI